MKAKAGLILFGSAACLLATAAEAQLVRQRVEGVWRQCTYESRARLGTANPRRRLGMPDEQVARVGRGEPCPATYPREPTPRRRPAGPSTWSSDSPPN